MNIHEYQAKALLSSYNIPVSGGRIVMQSDDAERKAEE
jgi:succinyl-CoA synthetase beta subunit